MPRTTASRVTRSTSVKAASSGGRGQTKSSRRSRSSSADLTRELLEAVKPLCEMFATVDDVFTEEDALSPEMRQASLGRIYRTWKSVRKQLDPDFDSAQWRHDRRNRRDT